MRIFLSLFIFFFLSQCGKPKTVFICGDHVCVNKNEAEQYFEDNLSIEVKIIDKNVKEEIDLVELNLNKNLEGTKKVKIFTKNNTKKNLRTLSNDEKNKIKNDVKKKAKEKKLLNKKIVKKQKSKKFQKKQSKNTKAEMNVNNNIKKIEIVDVCTLIDDCNIDEISKFLLKKGNKDKFPDITIRQ